MAYSYPSVTMSTAIRPPTGSCLYLKSPLRSWSESRLTHIVKTAMVARASANFTLTSYVQNTGTLHMHMAGPGPRARWSMYQEDFFREMRIRE